ncbi:NAD(P)/FAD-dependent oxidoreductase [Butyricicoccus sp.]|uniref:NAD(P)/FAD-dependent oxidoreductase n=1 Tax=Butyricicoccus sp. TaxID=2049021 RepID=UPI003F182E23
MKNSTTNNLTVAVIGAGAAGLMAAGTAAQQGACVLLFEHNEKVGRKLAITGKGRCNVTNNCDAQTFLSNVPQNPRFLYSALGAFSVQDTMAFFEKLGVPLKTERGSRVFPVSDRALDVVDALYGWVRRCGVTIVHDEVTDICVGGEETGAVCGVMAGGRLRRADRVIVATGGKSYPLTGSTGDGYVWAEKLGHTVTPLRASLVPLVCAGKDCPRLQGLSLKNVTLTIFENNKKLHEGFGEMLFTHFGISGPLVLSASSHMRKWDKAKYRAEIDFKPALDEATLDKRILSDFSGELNTDFRNSLGALLPRKLIPIVVERSGIDPHQKVNAITKKQRHALVRVLKHFELEITEPRPVTDAIITSGGISVREITPKTMESKKVPNLYFAGEIIDVDAYTGGFNLQIAWSTGYLAGLNAGQNTGE